MHGQQDIKQNRQLIQKLLVYKSESRPRTQRYHKLLREPLVTKRVVSVRYGCGATNHERIRKHCISLILLPTKFCFKADAINVEFAQLISKYHTSPWGQDGHYSDFKNLRVRYKCDRASYIYVRKMYQLDANNFTMIFSHKWPLHVSDIYMSIFRSSCI